jgi:glycerate dehydrogenase
LQQLFHPLEKKGGHTMNIVILDGYTCSPEDCSGSYFEEIGKVTAYPVTPQKEVLSRCENADIVITNKTYLGRETLQNLPQVKYIGLLSTGCNAVDLEAAKELNIPVTNVPDYSSDAVAQHTFALLLELCNQVGVHATATRNGQWEKSEHFCFWNTPLWELAGKTLGVFGMGSIGSRVAAIGQALGMTVIYHSRTQKDVPYLYVTKEELFQNSDVVSLHCPLTNETKNLINRETLALMKPTAILINTTRGDVICEEDLAQALNNHQLAGAGVDVLCCEPPTKGSPLLTAKNCLVTPHIAWAPKETRQRLLGIAVENVRAFLAGKPQNRVV